MRSRSEDRERISFRCRAVPPAATAALYDRSVSAIPVIDDWTTRLTGLPTDRIAASRERLDAFGIPHLSEELTRRADIDAAAAACMLDSAIDALTERGVEESKLVAKLR